MKIRSRIKFFVFIVLILILGLASRKYSEYLPGYIAEYSGDTLWALMVFFIFRFIFPKHTIFKTAVFSLIFSFAIEFSQLYQSDWFNYIRSIKYAGLIFGYGFLWNDLVCYTAGILAGVLIEKYFLI